jgi:hypothetical protein
MGKMKGERQRRGRKEAEERRGDLFRRRDRK